MQISVIVACDNNRVIGKDQSVDVFVWTDGSNIDPALHGSGNIAMDGNFDTDELAFIASLGSSTDINTITSTSFAFQTISGFSV